MDAGLDVDFGQFLKAIRIAQSSGVRYSSIMEPEVPHTMNTAPKVSVIVPCRNEERWIGVCLEALVRGSFPRSDYEILVIDNGSTDQTREIASVFADQVLVENTNKVSRARNLAAAGAHGEVLAFLDADCIPDRDWLDKATASLARDNAGIVGAHYLLPELPSWVEKNWCLDPPAGRQETNFVPAGNLIIRRQLFRQIGGFDEKLIACEDKELCARASRHATVISDDAIRVVHQGNPKTLEQLLRREMWHGRGALRSLRTRKTDKAVLATLAVGLGLALGVVGLVLLCMNGPSSGPGFLTGSVFLVTSTIAGSLWTRRKSLTDTEAAARLACLFVVYFVGRLIAMLFDLTSIDTYHGLTETRPEQQVSEESEVSRQESQVETHSREPS